MEKSKLTALFPLEEIPIPEDFRQVQTEESEVSQMVRKLQEDHAKILPVQGPAEKNDFVSLENPAQLVNMARCRDSLLVQACLGHAVGEELPDGHQIVSVRRKIVPEIDMAFLQTLALPGVDTPERLRAYCRAEILKEKYKEQENLVIDFLETEWLQRCKFELDSRELQDTVSKLQILLDKELREAEGPSQELFSRFLRMMGADDSCEDLDAEKTLFRCAEKHLKTALLGNECLKQYGAKIDRVPYEREIAKYARQDHVPVETVEQEYPYSLFLNNKCEAQIRSEIRKFLRARHVIVSGS